jgi:glycosyltransferase involved in cell wall biosynthesis
VADPISTPDLSIIIPALDEDGNIGALVERCHQTIARIGAHAEVIVVDGGSTDGTVAEAEAAGARVLRQKGRGYGGALRTGFTAARGRFIQTMDSDLSHEPEVIQTLWEARDRADVVIASRYVRGGAADMPRFRAVLSRILNVTFTTAFRLPVHDISSGFRLYRADALRRITFDASDFDVLEEILILIFVGGGSVTEVPFHYRPRQAGRSHAKLFRFGLAYAKTFFKMRRLRREGQKAEGKRQK